MSSNAPPNAPRGPRNFNPPSGSLPNGLASSRYAVDATVIQAPVQPRARGPQQAQRQFQARPQVNTRPGAVLVQSSGPAETNERGVATSTANPAPYVAFPDPDVPFFNKIGAYTLAVIEPSDSACSGCKRIAFKIRIARGHVAKVLHGQEIHQEFEAICEHALQKKFDSECRTTKPSEQCRYCTISFYEHRQAQFIERITKVCYVGKRGQERNTYLPPVDSLDEKHPFNWTAPAIPTAEESDVPAPLEQLQEAIPTTEESDVPAPLEQSQEVINETDKIISSKFEEPLVHSAEVVEVQGETGSPMSKKELEHSTFEPAEVEEILETPIVPETVEHSKSFWNSLGFWITMCLLSLGMLIAFSGVLRHIIQAGPILPPVAIDTTHSDWDYVYVPPVSEELLLPIPSASTKGPQSTTTTHSTPTFTQPADPTPSPEPSSSIYNTIVDTATFAFGTPAKVATFVGVITLGLGVLHFGPSIVARFTE